jgi:tetratricopeptide (TPR) repeat protein
LVRAPEEARVVAPEIPEDVQYSDLDRTVRARLRTLSKDNAEGVGQHLVMAGRLLDSDPELSYEHAQAAVRRAGRVDVVREAAGLAAYKTGRYAEALRELRTVRRLNGSSEHLAIMADCERGLGRPERAIALAASDEAEGLEAGAAIELAIVVSGARLDLGEAEAAHAVLSESAIAKLGGATGIVAVRVAQARAAALEALGRPDDAAASLAGFSAAELAEAGGESADEDEVVVFDLDDGADDDSADDQVRDTAPGSTEPAPTDDRA